MATLGRPCLAPSLLAGLLLALSGCTGAAPLQADPPVLVSFPGELVRNLTDLERTTVSAAAGWGWGAGDPSSPSAGARAPNPARCLRAAFLQAPCWPWGGGGCGAGEVAQ